MAWNRSTEDTPETLPVRHKPRVRYGLVAALIVVIGGLAAWLFLIREPSASAESKPVAKKPIPVVQPASAAKTQTVTSKKPRNRRPKLQQKLTASIGKLPDLPRFTNAPTRVYGEVNGKSLFPRKLFKTHEENHIAGLITAKPGERCVLSGFLPGQEERFLASLDVPVEFEEIDTPDERAVKEYMIELKKEMKERVAEGEKITDIVQGLRNELNDLANMRDKMNMKFSLLQKEGTVEEIMQYYDEANGLLKEYGMDPLPLRSNHKELYQTYLERKKQKDARQPTETSAGNM